VLVTEPVEVPVLSLPEVSAVSCRKRHNAAGGPRPGGRSSV